MSALNRIRVYWAVPLCAAVLVSACCRSREESAERTQAPAVQEARAAKPGADLGLSFSRGGPTDASLIVLRLFSGDLRQMELDKASKKGGQTTPVEPIRLSVPREAWAKVEFRALDRAGSPAAPRALAGAVLVEAPETESVSLGPRDTLTALYRIPTANLPPPGTLVLAEMKSPGEVILSEAIPVPAPPETDMGLQLRQAEIQLKLKSWSEAGRSADLIVARYPDEPAGYWIKGQALEGEGRDTDALKTYHAALEKFLAKKDAGRHEPPLPILIKIRDLEEKLFPAAKK